MASDPKVDKENKKVRYRVVKSRVFNIMQYAQHLVTGETLITEEQIKIALLHKTIKEWAYVWHNSDTYSLEDEEQERKRLEVFYHSRTVEQEQVVLPYLPQLQLVKDIYTDRDVMSWEDYYNKHKRRTAGTIKPLHVHIVCRCDKPMTTKDIARWFGVPENFVDCPKGHGAFADCVEYLTHENPKEQAKGKFLYKDEVVSANFNFREMLDKKNKNRDKYGRDLTEKEEIRMAVMYGEKTLRQVAEEKPLAYADDFSKLEQLRKDYLSNQAPMPTTRINYYVCGRGGVGKGLLCRALARSLYPNLTNDDDIFFEVGAKGVAFDGYDGQPVIIWNDRRGYDLVKELGGRGNFFNVFDMHPTRGKQNVKYSSVCLVNTVNIVNGIQDWDEFLNSIVGEYEKSDGKMKVVEDKGQSYRRFPFIIPIHETDFDLMMNKGVFDGTREYTQYYEHKGIRGNMQRIREKCQSNEILAKKLEMQTVAPVVEKHQELLLKHLGTASNEDEIMAMFSDYGKTQEQIEDERKYAPPEPMTDEDYAEYERWLRETPEGRAAELRMIQHWREQEEAEERKEQEMFLNCSQIGFGDIAPIIDVSADDLSDFEEIIACDCDFNED